MTSGIVSLDIQKIKDWCDKNNVLMPSLDKYDSSSVEVKYFEQPFGWHGDDEYTTNAPDGTHYVTTDTGLSQTTCDMKAALNILNEYSDRKAIAFQKRGDYVFTFDPTAPQEFEYSSLAIEDHSKDFTNKFKSSFGNHDFSDKEILDLLSGASIEFDAVAKSGKNMGEPYHAIVKLGDYKFKNDAGYWVKAYGVHFDYDAMRAYSRNQKANALSSAYEDTDKQSSKTPASDIQTANATAKEKTGDYGE